MSEPLEIDVFWSFRSPWSYLATGRLHTMQQTYNLVVNFRPVYPILVRIPDFLVGKNPQWQPYFQLDMRRASEFLDIPLTWPDPDPVRLYPGEDGLPRAHEVQPHIHRLTRLGVVAAELGRGIEFADEVGNTIWRGIRNWHESDHLTSAASRAGLTLEAMDQTVADESDRLEAVIQENQAAHTRAGHWGVPTCSFRGEPFFGQDRLDVLLWRLKQEGLQPR